MTISSLSTLSIGASAITGLNASTDQISASTYRLSSGNRFYRAGDDVASLSISTKLQSQVAAHRQGLLNNSQADSMLQVAYGGLTQIGSILDDMKALSVQANSGALTSTERAALDLEFQNLKEQIDSIASSTNFGGVKLLDGSTSSQNALNSSGTSGSKAQGALTINAAFNPGDTVVLNGATFTATTAPVAASDFQIGVTTAATATNLAAVLNASTNLGASRATYQVSGSSIQIISKAGGRLGGNFIIDEANSSGNGSFTVAANSTNLANTFVLGGGADDGIFMGGSVISGVVGDTLVNTHNQTAASATLSFSSIATSGETVTLDDGNGGNITFTFTTAATAATDIEIGADVEEMLGNIVQAVENYRRDSTASDTYVLNQLSYQVDGNSLVISNKMSGNVLDLAGAAANLNTNASVATVSTTTLNNGTNTGINVAGIANKDFVGTISGFSATYNTANNITASVTVGDHTYTSSITSTNPTAATMVRFSSASGGYFDVELAAGGATVSNQTDANAFANRLTAAFSSMTIYQSRAISNFAGVGTLAGGTAEMQLDDFSDIQVDDLQVTASPGSGQDASIGITINGEVFRSTNLGDTIGARETITLTSLENGNRQIRIINGDSEIDLSNATDAATFETDLRSSLGLGSGSGALSFQVGATDDNNISIALDSAQTDSLFGGEDIDITTANNAASASDVIDDALDQLNSILAEVGSTQAALGYAYSATTNSINEIDRARAALADTDVASESTIFAAAVVQQQAAISVLAQTQRLGSNLLALLNNN